MDFKLRKWQQSDAESVSKYANNMKIANNLRDGFPVPYTLDDAKWYVNDCLSKGERQQYTMAITVNDEAVGSIGVFIKDNVYCKTAELGYWLGEEFWGKGIMSSAVREICTYVFENYDVVRIFAEPFSYNLASRKVLEKSGFVLEGTMKMGAYKNKTIFDYCMYALLRS